MPGWKTYITACLIVLSTLAMRLQIISIPMWHIFLSILIGLAFVFLRMAIANLERLIKEK